MLNILRNKNYATYELYQIITSKELTASELYEIVRDQKSNKTPELPIGGAFIVPHPLGFQEVNVSCFNQIAKYLTEKNRTIVSVNQIDFSLLISYQKTKI